MKNKVLMFMLLVILFYSLPMNVLASNGELFPTNEELGIDDHGYELLFEKYPYEHYSWDNNLVFFKLNGIKPEVGDPEAISMNTIENTFLHGVVTVMKGTIFILQLAVHLDFVESGVAEIKDEIIAVKDVFFDEVFGIFVLVLIGYMVLAYAIGNTGLAIRHFLIALVLIAMFVGLVEKIDWVVGTSANLASSIGGTVLGIANLSPIINESATSVAENKIIDTANNLWQLNVMDIWRMGEFGTRDDVFVTDKEQEKLKDEDITVNVGDSWTDALLEYHPKSEKRMAMVKVLADDEIEHDPKFNPGMLKEAGAVDRMGDAIFALFSVIIGLVFFAIVGGYIIIASLGFVLLAAASPIVVPLPLLVGIGYSMLRKYLGLFFTAVAFIIASYFYMGIVILALFIVSKITTIYLAVFILNSIVLSIGIVLSKKIVSSMAPAVFRLTTFGKNVDYNGGMNGVRRKAEPESAEDVTERKNYGTSYQTNNTASTRPGDPRATTTAQKTNESAEDVIERKIPINDWRNYDQEHQENRPVLAKMTEQGLSPSEKPSTIEEKTDQIMEDVSQLKERVDTQQNQRDYEEYRERRRDEKMPELKDKDMDDLG